MTLSSSAPNKEYMEKVATGGFKELPITQKVLEIYEMRQRENGRDPTHCTMLGCFQMTLERNGFHTSFSPKSTPIWKKRRISFLKRRTELDLV